MRRIDVRGQRFGRLTAIEPVPVKRIRKNGRVDNEIKWLCSCECGMTTMAYATDLINGRKQSCGCLHAETIKTNRVTHGHSNERLYTIWGAMKQRCYYNKAQHRANYSMRGIRVCDEWLNDYEAFRTWSYEHGYHEQPEGTPHREMLSIDRIDPDKNYCPENCQWISCDANLRKRFTDRRGVIS